MKCPVDNETLLMTERQGVEIDYCPKCRGIWLDRGELDKLIEVAASKAMPAVTQAEPQRASPPPPPPVSEAARSHHAQDRSVSHGGRAPERGGFDQSVRHTSVPDPRIRTCPATAAANAMMTMTMIMMTVAGAPQTRNGQYPRRYI